MSVIDLEEKRQQRGEAAHERGEAFCISVATADDLELGYTDDGVLVFAPFPEEPLRLAGLSQKEAREFGTRLIELAAILATDEAEAKEKKRT